MYNAGKVTLASPRLADFNSGEQFVNKSNDRFSRNESSPMAHLNKFNSQRISVSKGPVDQVVGFNSNNRAARYNSYKNAQKSRNRPNFSTLDDGLRPYELWKKQMVTKSESVTLG